MEVQITVSPVKQQGFVKEINTSLNSSLDRAFIYVNDKNQLNYFQSLYFLVPTVTSREVQPRRKTQFVIFLSDKLPIFT